MTDDTMITDSERDLLRFPAHADGLLRRGSPVWMQWLPAAVGPVALCAPHCDSNGEMCVCVSDGGASQLLSLVSLDLTDATGRAHLAWWMARHPLVAGTDAASDRYPVWRPFYAGNRRWGLDQWGPMFSPAESRGNGYVPSLITLNPADPRLLPDGSRLVDALALSLVGRHLLAGGGQ